MALKREHDNVVVTLGTLSELLRVSLDERLPQEVPLSDELDLLEADPDSADSVRRPSYDRARH